MGRGGQGFRTLFLTFCMTASQYPLHSDLILWSDKIFFGPEIVMSWMRMNLGPAIGPRALYLVGTEGLAMGRESKVTSLRCWAESKC